MADHGKKRENVFKGLQRGLSNLGKNARRVDETLAKAIEKLMRRMDRDKRERAEKMRPVPRPRKERGA